MSFTDTLFFVVLASGFGVGFGHCIGMCGPIVVSLSLNLRGRPILVPHLLYNAGRITTYAMLGAIMGLTGSFTTVTTNIAGIQKGVMILAGVVISLMGLAMSGWVPLGALFADSLKPMGIFSAGLKRLSAARSAAAYLPLGLLLGLLPCGPVYTALITAARAGMDANGPLEGLLTGAGLMLAFGLGTVPALLLVAKLADLGWLKRRDVICKISGVLMVLVGIYFVVKGVRY
jgi:hypothetical protein